MQRVSRDGESEKEEVMNELPKSEINRLIDEWIIGRNAERDRAIIRRRLFDGICYEPLAEEFDLSVRQVKNIVYKCQVRIFKHTK